MKELSLNILDIAQNSVTARSTLIRIDLEETDEKLAYIDKLCMENPELLIEDDFNDFQHDEGDKF